MQTLTNLEAQKINARSPLTTTTYHCYFHLKWKFKIWSSFVILLPLGVISLKQHWTK